MKNLITKLLIACIISTSFASQAQAFQGFIGQIMMFGGNYCPRDWIPADGRELSRYEYANLFSIYGSLYGGDNRTTFAVPDLRGRFPTHWGDGPGLTSRSIGQKGGVESVSLSINEIPSHSHDYVVKAGRGVKTSAGGSFVAESGIFRTNGSNVTLNASSISNTGGSQAHENMPPFQVVSFCIALDGLYPNRPF